MLGLISSSLNGTPSPLRKAESKVAGTKPITHVCKFANKKNVLDSSINLYNSSLIWQ